MKEVEILFEVLESKKEALKKLAGLNYKGEILVEDSYFYDPKRKDLQPDKKGHLKGTFRVRKKGNKVFITYKKDIFDGKKWLYSEEKETLVQDRGKIISIIKALGLKKLLEIRNKRSVFLTNRYEVVLEDVKGLGLFLEVERLKVKHNENIARLNKDMWAFVRGLGIKVKEVKMGKPEMMIKKGFKS